MLETRTMGTYRAATLTILRILTGLLFMQHGAQKLFGLLGGFGGPGRTAELMSQMGGAGVIEFFGGLLIVLGLLTRVAAAVAAIEMLVAYSMAHFPGGPWPILNHGEPALLYFAVFLSLTGSGAGPFSVDRALQRMRTPREQMA
ncbi:MAG TPA: DoxX family protein [Longimicrobiaceae bacterium]|nr:DoxX family protein [Longimicrobiaceae bacterium]